MYRFFQKSLVLLFGSISAAVIALLLAYVYVASELPPTAALKEIKLQTPLRIYTQSGKFLGEFGEQRRIPVNSSEIPEQLIQAFLAIEDDRFFEHVGVDYAGLLRAAIILLTTGEKKQGGSTITMQLARNYFLSSERTYTRKIKEIFLALQIESQFTKEEILNLYLNKIFLGHRAYGVGAAAEVYYGTSIGELDLAQSAMLAGLPKAPSKYNPLSYPQRAIVRRNQVLDRMLQLEMINDEEYQIATASPITATWHQASLEVKAPYIAEMVRAEMINRYGEAAYTGGYKVYTTLNSDYQKYADASIKNSLIAYDVRHGYRNTWDHFDLQENTPSEILSEYHDIGSLKPAVVVDISRTTFVAVLKENKQMSLGFDAYSWARKKISERARGLPPKEPADVVKVGDLIWLTHKKDGWKLRQVPDVSGAIVVVDPDNGAILALSGGFDFGLSKFNRAIQAQRQPGSSFKPFIYSAALNSGYTPASLVNDAPVVFSDAGARQGWRPSNYSGRFFGPTRLREALTMSRNLISVRLADSIGVRKIIEFVSRFGFDRSDLPFNLTLALGSGTVTPLKLAAAYATFANGGFKVSPYLIETIYDTDKLIYQAQPPIVCPECFPDPAVETENTAGTATDTVTKENDQEAGKYAEKIISSGIAYQITTMLKDVVKGGTGRRARVLGRNDLAGKTGTTNNQQDAWFSGFNRNMVCVTWVGFDNHSPLGTYETGSRAALPIWIDFMRSALKDKPETTYHKPDNIVSVQIDPETGLLAHPAAEDAIIETFRAQYLPKDVAAPVPEGENKTDAIQNKIF